MSNRVLGAMVLAMVVVLGGASIAVFAITDPLHPTMRAAVDAVETVRTRGDAFGVVVLGSSVDRNALGRHEALGNALTTKDVTVVAANLGLSAGSIEGLAPIMADIWAADPDLLIVNPEIFLSRSRRWDVTVRERIENWLERDHSFVIDEPVCKPASETLEERRVRLERFLTIGDREISAIRSFVAEAERREVPILWFLVPRSPEWDTVTEGRSVAVREELLAAVGASETHGPFGVPRFARERYCDYSHLRLDAHVELLEAWAPDTISLIRAIRS